MICDDPIYDVLGSAVDGEELYTAFGPESQSAGRAWLLGHVYYDLGTLTNWIEHVRVGARVY